LGSNVPQSCSPRMRSILGSIMLHFLHLVIETALEYQTKRQSYSLRFSFFAQLLALCKHRQSTQSNCIVQVRFIQCV
jgi:hypothetical protein